MCTYVHVYTLYNHTLYIHMHKLKGKAEPSIRALDVATLNCILDV